MAPLGVFIATVYIQYILMNCSETSFLPKQAPQVICSCGELKPIFTFEEYPIPRGLDRLRHKQHFPLLSALILSFFLFISHLKH